MASRITEIGRSLKTYLGDTLSIDDVVAEFLPDQEVPTERGDLLVLIDWQGGRLGDADGNIALGAAIDLYTDQFILTISRRDGDLAGLIDDVQRVCFGLNYRWAPPSAVSYKRVAERRRQQAIDSNQQMILTRSVEVVLDVSYGETAA